MSSTDIGSDVFFTPDGRIVSLVNFLFRRRVACSSFFPAAAFEKCYNVLDDPFWSSFSDNLEEVASCQSKVCEFWNLSGKSQGKVWEKSEKVQGKFREKCRNFEILFEWQPCINDLSRKGLVRDFITYLK